MKTIIFRWFIILIIIITLLSSVMIINVLIQNNTEEKSRILLENSRLFEGILDTNDGTDYESIFDPLLNGGHFIELRLTLLNENGQVLYDSDRNYMEMELHKDREEIIAALEGKVASASRFSITLRQHMIYVAIPYNSMIHDIAVIRTAYPMSSIYYFTDYMIRYAFVFILLGSILALIATFKINNALQEPLSKVSYSMKRILKGFYGDKIYYEKNDSIGDLVLNFNELSDYMNAKMTYLINIGNNLESILSSLLTSVIVLDKSKRIVYCNKNAESFLDTPYEQALNRPFVELIRNYELNRFIEKFFATAKENFIEIAFEDTLFRFTLNFIEGTFNEYKEGVVLVINDVTEIRKLEKMRRDFVANVTHELKTPLTSIKGFIEVLKEKEDLDAPTRVKFLDIVDIETDRLTDLINDLLFLSEIENNRGQPSLFDMQDTLSEVMTIMEPIASNKKIKMSVHCDKKIIVNGDRNRFKQMLINLIDNSIKFCNINGLVEINACVENHKICISVIDNGIGIEQKHLDRLFERFYRTDKSRSRSEGGTGLGLAIVKHIVNNFGGTIEVESEINKGTKFIIRLPLKPE
jgi:two-component system, OmpR family, phosphate regulon sensor histidine kinase PhoR